MKSFTPLVSIIVPVYNRPELLRRALISVENQTYKNWECIITDDGSTDETIDVANEFVQKDKRFKLLKNEHANFVHARNNGIFAAKGKYIALLDSDDEYLPDHLKIRVEELEENPDLDLLHGGIKVTGDEMITDKNDPNKKVNLYDPAVYLGPTYFGKKEVFTSLGGFRYMKMGVSADFMERAMKNYSVRRADCQTYIYHHDHPGSLSKSQDKDS